MATSLTSANLPERLKGNDMNKLLGFAVVALAFALSACNTVKGVGQDIQKAGSAIEGAAKK
jgi:predicted small secreted protein